MKKEVIFENIKMKVGFWFSAEYYENDILKYGEGCHSSEKKRILEIKKKFENLKKK